MAVQDERHEVGADVEDSDGVDLAVVFALQEAPIVVAAEVADVCHGGEEEERRVLMVMDKVVAAVFCETGMQSVVGDGKVLGS